MDTRTDLLADLAGAQQNLLEFVETLPDAVFFDGSAARWSPAHTLDHLTRSKQPVVQVLKMPRLALAAFGGPKARPSRSYETLRTLYRAALAGGGAASGRYLPDLKARDRAQLLLAYQTVSDGLQEALARWPEGSLDRYQLPHPILGPLTLRELLLFTLYHDRHHLDGLKARHGGPELALSASSR